MDPTTLAILGLIITSLITIAGWVVTYRKQVEILKEQRSHSKTDRELAVFRERAKKVSELIAHLTRVSHITDALAHMPKRRKGTPGDSGEAFGRFMSELDEIGIIASSHDFRMVRNAVGDDKVRVPTLKWMAKILKRKAEIKEEGGNMAEWYAEIAKQSDILSIELGNLLVEYENTLKTQ